jgi:hypothetical protein
MQHSAAEQPPARAFYLIKETEQNVLSEDVAVEGW